MNCKFCGVKLSKDEVGISKKLLRSEKKNYMCFICLSDYLDCSEDDLKLKIQEFKEQGCTLFI